MRRIINRVVLIVFVVVALVFSVFTWWRLAHKNTDPVIKFSKGELSVSIADGEKALLADVIAKDREDGDLSDKVIVENISRFLSRGVCRVTYAVQDSDNAVVKAIRNVRYTDYTSPRFSLSAPLIFKYSKTIDPTEFLSATDCIDGDLTKDIQATLLEDSSSITGAGDWKIRFRVTNSMGEQVTLTTVVTVHEMTPVQRSLTPQIQLTDYLVYLPIGSEFHPESYIKSATLEDFKGSSETEASLTAKVRVDEESARAVDMSKAGCYTVGYTCESNDDYSGHVNLVVVVYDPAVQ